MNTYGNAKKRAVSTRKNPQAKHAGMILVEQEHLVILVNGQSVAAIHYWVQ